MQNEGEALKFQAAVWSATQGNVRPLVSLLRADHPMTERDKASLADFINGDMKAKRGRPKARLYSQTWYLHQAVEKIRELRSREGMSLESAIFFVDLGTQMQGRKPLNLTQVESELRRAKKRSTK